MQSHASRHVVCEKLAERWPYSSPPFEKACRGYTDALAKAHMDRLQGLQLQCCYHTNGTWRFCLQVPRPDEVAEAYGDRQMPKVS